MTIKPLRISDLPLDEPPRAPERTRTRLGEIGDVIGAELERIGLNIDRCSYTMHGVEWNVIDIDGTAYPLLLLSPKKMA